MSQLRSAPPLALSSAFGSPAAARPDEGAAKGELNTQTWTFDARAPPLSLASSLVPLLFLSTTSSWLDRASSCAFTESSSDFRSFT